MNFQGSTEIDEKGGGPAFLTFYTRGERVLAVAGLGKDPLVSYASGEEALVDLVSLYVSSLCKEGRNVELLRLHKMPSASELKAGMTLLDVPLADPSTIVKAVSAALLSPSTRNASATPPQAPNPAFLAIAAVVVLVAILIGYYSNSKTRA
jgi:hypothetical protein